MAVDAEEFDLIINTWAAEQADRRSLTPVRSEPADTEIEDGPDEADRGSKADDDDSIFSQGADLVGVAVDGKAVRGAKRADGTKTQLLAALRHDTGMVIGQRNVENDKTNEILAFAPLLEPLALSGRVVTADAIHTQKTAARLVVGKGGHYIVGIKRKISRSSRTRRSTQGTGSTSIIWSTRPVNVLMAASTATGSGQHRSRLRSPSLTRGSTSSSSESPRRSTMSGSASRPGSTSPTYLPTTQPSSTCSDSFTDTGPSKTASTGSEM